MSAAYARTIHELLVRQAERFGDAPAIVVEDRPPLDYAALRAEVDRAVAALAAAGIGRRSRVAVALSNIPEAVTAIFAALSAGVCVPLNPALGQVASEALLRRLRVDALIVPEDVDSPIEASARLLGLSLLRLASAPERPAGSVLLRFDNARPGVARSIPSPDDPAVVFHTSGTTSIPKVVPLTHAQLVARSSAQPISSGDRCLLVPPIFTGGVFGHSLCSPLAAGAAIGFARGAGVDALLDALDALSITYFSANPALLDSLGERVAQRGAIAPTVRYIRSSSSALSPEQQHRAEAALGVPVVQGYGMTEVGTIAQNPLPPASRIPGSAGVSVGPDIAVMDENGALVAANVTGELVVRGPGVMSGYEDNPEANRCAFRGGWFRTGDSGHLGDGGYVFITGRIKELINRGGLKVAPAEIDDALRRHPDVADAVAFGVPHPTLGEDVAAAVVVRRSETVSEQQLREFAFAHLAPHKVPSTILYVAALPRTAAGKLNRSEFAEAYAAALRPTFRAPRDARERLVAAIISEVVHVERVGIDDNFFALGGDSIRGAQVMARVNAAIGSNLGPDALFRLPTVASFAAALAAPSPVAPPPLTAQDRRSRTQGR
jgi:acyl-CoA synthetase (AMP-forming)/AMP-acid ligase II